MFHTTKERMPRGSTFWLSLASQQAVTNRLTDSWLREATLDPHVNAKGVKNEFRQTKPLLHFPKVFIRYLAYRAYSSFCGWVISGATWAAYMGKCSRTVLTWSYRPNGHSFLKNKAPQIRLNFGSLYLCSQTSYQKVVKLKDAHFICPITDYFWPQILGRDRAALTHNRLGEGGKGGDGSARLSHHHLSSQERVRTHTQSALFSLLHFWYCDKT